MGNVSDLTVFMSHPTVNVSDLTVIVSQITVIVSKITENQGGYIAAVFANCLSTGAAVVFSWLPEAAWFNLSGISYRDSTWEGLNTGAGSVKVTGITPGRPLHPVRPEKIVTGTAPGKAR